MSEDMDDVNVMSGIVLELRLGRLTIDLLGVE